MEKQNKTILILRHATTVDTSPLGDHARELTQEGRREAERVGVWIAQSGLQPEYKLCSSAQRTVETASRCVQSANVSFYDNKFIEKELYNAPTQVLIQRLAAIPDRFTSVILVAHNPGISHLVNFFTSGSFNKGGYVAPATLSHFEFEGAWQDLTTSACYGGMTKKNQVSGNMLPVKFPFPDVNGQELRARPAYYYCQAAAVPYRYGPKGLEILIITCCKGNRWGVPKGIHDPGKTLQEMAVIETVEEAGVFGEVIDEPLGVYEIDKWGASCSITVFSLKVLEVYSESQWPENNRERKWIPVSDVPQYIHDQTLQGFIEKLALSMEGKA